MASPTRFDVELWSAGGKRIAEITHLVQNLRFIEERNEAELITFELDLYEFERYMTQDVGASVLSNFREGQTEIKLKMNGNYLFGTQLQDAPINLSGAEARINVVADGYLNFFADRYPDPAIAYTNTEAVEIFYGLVQQAQAVPNGNYGIVKPGSYYTTGKLRDRTYDHYTSSTKLNMQRLTNLVDGNFDFKFLADKTLMTYPALGSPRSDFTLMFDPQLGRSSVKEATLTRSAHQLYNQIIGQGSGLGDDMITSIKDDTASQIEFGLRQKAVQFNEVKLQPTLDENTQARLDRLKQLLRMPQTTLTGNDLPEVPLEIGDVIPLVFKGADLLSELTGLYRVERREVNVDQNHFIGGMTLYFDKTGEYEG